MKLLMRAIALSGTLNYASCFALPPPEQIVISGHVKAKLQDNADLVRGCAGYEFPHVVCINRYGSVIKGDFERKVLDGSADSYASTLTPGDSSFGFVSEATFVVFDPVRGRQILGPSPIFDFMFSLPNLTHEGPVYVPDTNELYFARVKPGFLPQLVVNLSATPPTLSEKLADPPVYAGTGGRYKNGEIIYATISGDGSLGGNSFRPGLYALDVKSGKSRTLLNNYYGYYFSSMDDMDIDAKGQIWCTNNDYGRGDSVNTQPPQMGSGTFRFDPQTGQPALVENSLQQPNGIAFSPDYRTLYITDTGAGEVTISPFIPAPRIHWNATKARAIYAFDVDDSGKHLLNKRPIYQAMEYAADGIKFSRDGYLLAATGHGIDVLTADGTPVVRVQTNFTVANLAWVGTGEGQLGELWAVGRMGVARVKWALKGP